MSGRVLRTKRAGTEVPARSFVAALHNVQAVAGSTTGAEALRGRRALAGTGVSIAASAAASADAFFSARFALYFSM